jgi:hypothetical protein
MTKQTWLAAAEVIDAFRVVPRMILFGYSMWTVKVVWYVLGWYTALPAVERSLEASGLAAGVITAVTGLATFAIKIYLAGGRDWTAGKEEEK